MLILRDATQFSEKSLAARDLEITSISMFSVPLAVAVIHLTLETYFYLGAFLSLSSVYLQFLPQPKQVSWPVIFAHITLMLVTIFVKEWNI